MGKLEVIHFTFNGMRLWLHHMYVGTYAVISSEMTALPVYSEEGDAIVGLDTLITFNATGPTLIAKAEGDELAVVREALGILRDIHRHNIKVIKDEVDDRIDWRKYKLELDASFKPTEIWIRDEEPRYIGIAGHQMNEAERQR